MKVMGTAITGQSLCHCVAKGSFAPNIWSFGRLSRRLVSRHLFALGKSHLGVIEMATDGVLYDWKAIAQAPILTEARDVER